MRRANVVTLVLLLIVAATATGVVLVRNGRDDGPRPTASATPGGTPTSAAPTTTASPSTTSSPSARPKPTGPGPRDREYDVVYAARVNVDQGAAAVAALNGEVVTENATVGVATVRADRDFAGRAMRDKRIHGVVTNRAFHRPAAPDPTRSSTRGTGVNARDLTDRQWDMGRINVRAAHARTKGDKRVLVAVLDTGVDGTHPDLRAAFDPELSRNFVTDYPGADGPCEVRSCVDPANVDEEGHGTHVAGTIAAADDGRGITGIAPDVRLLNLRTGQDSGLFFLRPTVDALVYAADIGVDVANMSYFIDPWLFNCPRSPSDSAVDQFEQRAIIEGTRRAVEYAHGKGVTLVAAAGNEHVDLSKPRVDTFSPDFPENAARVRRVDNSCYVLPTELPHVIQVSATARDDVKADYSDWGLGQITVTAPGGSQYLADGRGPYTENLVLSTYPEALAREEGAVARDGKSRSTTLAASCVGGDGCAYYRMFSGTSMASPHVAGVAALIVSTFGVDDPAHPGQLTMRPDDVLKRLRDTASPMPCPSPRTLDYPGRGADYTATCEGTTERNGFYGDGMVDADAATRR